MSPPRRFRWGFVALGVALVAVIAWLSLSQKPPKPKGPPPVSVTVAKATSQDVPLSVTALGAAQAWQGVLINPEVNGRVTYVAREGDDVRVGALLVQIDSGPYEAALTQAEGALRRDQALLAGARTDLARYQTLVAQNSIARQTYEDQEATVKQDEGVVLADQGNVRAAQVNVNFCHITSPVNGRVGIRLVDPGNIVTTTLTTGIISVNQIQPIAVTFTIPQGQFQQLSSASAAFTKPLTTQALSQETGASLGEGELVVADNHVDPTTGTVTMKARFENPARQLWPGQFVNVRVTLQTVPHATTIPATAVNQGPNGAFAYVIGPGNKVVARPIKVMATEGGLAVISSGVSPGDSVVTDGQMSLRNGSIVATAGAGRAGAGHAGGGGKHGS
ncbi:MAG TPA: efflux RND transporter periplasmic adaptor subunit [Caulobacteraceae bacterium]|nr:efflux RND transporter periplasmic adaptor subunit [Caulobacteraceae bacterium]